MEAWAPAQAVSQASFLLETITSSIARSENPQQFSTQTSTDEQPIRSAIADPFQIDTSSEIAQDSTPTTNPLSVATLDPETTKDVESHGPTAQSHAITQKTGLLDDSDVPKSHGSTASTFLLSDGTESFSAIPESLDQTDSKQLQQPSTKSSLEATPTSSAQFHILTSLINVAAGHNGPGEIFSDTSKHTVSFEVKGSYTSSPSHDNDWRPAAMPTTTAVLSYTSRHSDEGMPVSQTTTGGSNSGSLSTLFPPTEQYTYTEAPPSSLGGSQSAKASNAEYIIGEQTLKPGGPAVTISGTVISLLPGATAVVIESGTSSLTMPLGIGSYILAGIGGATPVTGESKASIFVSAEESPYAPTSSLDEPYSRSAMATITDANVDEVATVPDSRVEAATPTHEATPSDSTTKPSTNIATERPQTSSDTNTALASEGRSGASAPETAGVGVTSFGRRDTGSSAAALQIAFPLSVLALLLSMS